jgi:hypothetical protein
MATPEEMAATMMASIPEKTGRSLREWMKILEASGLEKHGEMVNLLKKVHGVTHGYANLIAVEARKGGEDTPADDLIEAQYAGPRADLTNIRDALLALVTGFGDDVVVAPKKSYISLRRGRQFALIQPSTRTRIDVGIHLPGRPAAGRLEASGSFNAMVSHRVRIGAVAEVDTEVAAWLREAYDQA